MTDEFNVFAPPSDAPKRPMRWWEHWIEQSGLWKWLIRAGFWELRDGDWYVNGHWTWNYRATRRRRERQMRLLVALASPVSVQTPPSKHWIGL